MSKLLALVAPLLFASCALLAPQPDASRFYTLATLAAADPGGPTLAGVTLGVGPVRLPAYLDRAEIVTRVDPNQVDYLELARWAEPLADDLAHVLAANFSVLLGPAQVRIFPWFDGTQPDWVVELDVRQCERAADGTGLFAAAWVVRDGRRHTIVEHGEAALREPAPPADTEASVAALSRAVGALSREVATALRRANGRG